MAPIRQAASLAVSRAVMHPKRDDDEARAAPARPRSELHRTNGSPRPWRASFTWAVVAGSTHSIVVHPQRSREIGVHERSNDGVRSPHDLPRRNALPEEGQRELAERLVGKIGVYRLEYATERPQPALERKRLADVVQSAGHLLELLGIEDLRASSAEIRTAQPRSWAASWLLVELHAVATERRPTMATLDANQRSG